MSTLVWLKKIESSAGLLTLASGDVVVVSGDAVGDWGIALVREGEAI
jgi:hypothetical protein